MVERAIDALRDVPGLVRRQDTASTNTQGSAERFHYSVSYWPGRCRGAREYVLSSGCRRRKRTRSQRMAMLPGRYLEPWEVPEVDLLRI